MTPRRPRRPVRRIVWRGPRQLADVSVEPPSPAPEAVFDRVSGPYGPIYLYDEEL